MTVDLEVAGRHYRATVTEVGHPPTMRLSVRLVRVTGEPEAPVDRRFDVRSTADGCVFVDAETGRVIDAALSSSGPDQWLVHLAGADIEVAINGRRRVSAETAVVGGEQRVHAPMPGRVLKVLVALGDAVAAGQPLVVIEAMKMENALPAPRAGTVAEVAVEEGASVESGRLLVRLS